MVIESKALSAISAVLLAMLVWSAEMVVSAVFISFCKVETLDWRVVMDVAWLSVVVSRTSMADPWLAVVDWRVAMDAAWPSVVVSMTSMADPWLATVVWRVPTEVWRVPMADPLFATVVWRLLMFISVVVVRLPRLVKLVPILVCPTSIVGAEIWFVDVKTTTVAVVRFAEERVKDAFDPVTDSMVVERLGMVALDAVRFAQVKPWPTESDPEMTWFPPDIGRGC
jgi:hypothetical protein